MRLDEAINAVNAQPVSYFHAIEKARNGGYICPKCGSGSGSSGTGGFSMYRDTKGKHKCRCFSCDAFGSGDHETQDTLGALRVIWGCDTLEVLKLAGYEVTGGYSAAREAQGLDGQADGASFLPTREEEAPRRDFTAYFERCRGELDGSAEAWQYLTGRGISRATAEAFGAGFDAKADPGEKGHFCKRLIFPAGVGCYVARAIVPTAPGYEKMFPAKARAEISNAKALYSGAPAVFVVEGIFDAMSIHEAGGQAVSLNSTSGKKRLVEQLKRRPTQSQLLLALDNDKAGQDAQPWLLEALPEIGARCAVVDLCSGHKDANEALTADRRAFTEAVQREILRAAGFLPTREEEAPKPKQADGFRFETVAEYIERGGFDADIWETMQAGELVTGFRQLDKAMNGWQTGLHIISGAPGTGKTAFCGQLADGIAESGRDVIYYSLEIPKAAMTARALARVALQQSGVRYIGEQSANEHYSALDILRSRCPADTLDQISDEYTRRVGDRLAIVDSKMTVDDIREHARQHFRNTGRKPVLIVDYLQILGLLSAAAQADAKRYTDDAVTALVELAKELNTHIFAISSLARSGYTKDADYSALKESGLIEYGASSVLALQLRLIYTKVKVTKENKKTGEISTSYREPTTAELDAEKQKSPRRLDLSVLKSRSGGVGEHIALEYYSRCDQFDEISSDYSAAAELAADTEAAGGVESWTDAATE